MNARTGRVLVDGVDVGAAAWDLKIQRDYVDASMFGNENKTYLVAQRDISGSFSGDLEPGAMAALGSAPGAVSLYIDKDITPVHRALRRLLGMPMPQHKMVEGTIDHVTYLRRDGVISKADVRFHGTRIFSDPGTVPHQLRLRARAKLEELRYSLWDRFLRPTIVIDQDEWQADEYEAHQEELWYEAMERSEHE